MSTTVESTNGKSLPSNREAESTVLGSMLRDNGTIPDALLIVRPDDFTTDANQRVCRAIAALYDAGKPVDLVSVADWLNERNQAKDVGYSYLYELLEAAPTAANAAYHAELVFKCSKRRRLAIVCNRIEAEARASAAPPDDLLAALQRQINELAQTGDADAPATLAQCVSESFDAIDRRQSGQAKGIATGWTDLDTLTAGFHDGELIIVASRPGVGKTAAAVNLAHHIGINEQIPLLFISLEQNRVELTDRLLCASAQVSNHRFRHGVLGGDEIRKIKDAGEELRACPVFIDHASVQSMLRIASNARRMKAKQGIRLLIVDYLQLVETDNRNAPRQEQVASVSRRLKQLARELKIPIVALAQLNRVLEGRAGNRPRLSDLRESGAIEADADVVLLLHRPELFDKSDRPNELDIIIAKQRNGPIGEITLTFQKEFGRLDNFAPGLPYDANNGKDRRYAHS